jgi:hypothetical protein
MSHALDSRPELPPSLLESVPQRPAAAVAAAVLAFEAAAVYLVLTLLEVIALGVGGVPDDGGDQAELLGWALGACVLAGLLLAGGVAAIRGTGRRLLLVATGIETALLVAAIVYAVVRWPSADELPDVDGLDDVADIVTTTVVVVFAVVLGVLALRLWLAAAPPVGRWLAATRRPGTPRGSLLGLLLPIAALAVAAVVVVFTAPAASSSGGSAGASGEYQGDSEWGQAFYSDGEPLTPPAAGDQLYSAASDLDAQSCYAGDMSACDTLFATAPVGDVYEWFGSSCAGRLDHETEGGCVDALGPAAD